MNSRTLIDTNVILRYLLDDNEEQALIAEHLIDGDAWTTPEVLAEVTYVLDCVYNASRKDIAAALQIIENKIELQPQSVYSRAIKEFSESKLDFVDCMIVAYEKEGVSRVFSFDKELNRRL